MAPTTANFREEDSPFLTFSGRLGPRDLRLRSFSGSEYLSRPFEFELELVSEELRIPFADVIGKVVSVGVCPANEPGRRYFNGYISRFVQLPGEANLARYRATMVPWLWFLSQSSDCRIFQNQSVPDIVSTIFRDFSLLDFEWRLETTYDPWEYCVQYRETPLNFVMRLLEQEGISFYFEHTADRHRLILDDRLFRPPCEYSDRVRFEHNVGEGVLRDENAVFSWRHEQTFRPGSYRLQDFNFKSPRRDLDSDAPSVIDQPHRHFEIYDFPGEYETRPGGEGWAKIRMQEEEATHATIYGDGNCSHFAAGHCFQITGLEHAADGAYLLTSVSHNAREVAFYSHPSDQGSEYENSFTCISRGIQYRPPRVTPKPFVQGTQTATVVGPAGREIYTDQHGRVIVQFHWDRRGRRDENSSCWIRVSQPWAGQNWGAVSIPRIGQEVIVDFLEGDPDRPIITGRVYNADQVHPYGLPANHAVSGLRSRSTPGGGGYNEMMMDDSKGAELVRVHAEKDMETTVEHDQTNVIKNCRKMAVGVDDTEQVGNNQTISVGNNQTTSVGTDQATQVGNNQTTQVGQNITIVAGENIVLGAGTSITLKCGASTIHMNQAGVISISGMLIFVAGAINTDITAPLTTISGAIVTTDGIINFNSGGLYTVMGGVTNIEGGKVNINPL